jgi:imidazole glycerol-phosphate synthase subunit HisH
MIPARREARVIAIVDYGMGNLRSVQKAFERMGVHARVTASPVEVLAADGVVLPGVGAFAQAMAHLTTAGLVAPLREVIARGTPFLGICLGLQLLFEESDEFGAGPGLGVFAGRVPRLFPAGPPAGVKIPHMGWNSLIARQASPVLAGVEEGAYVYFVHSYYVAPSDPSVVATETEYGGERFVSAVTRGNLFACQFHPEKSSAVGLRMLANFGEIAASR